MKNRLAAVMLAAVMTAGMLTGCGAGNSGSSAESQAASSAGSAASEAMTEASSEAVSEASSEAVSGSSSGAAVSSAAETDSGETADTTAAAIEDGTYLADFTTDSTMFHVNEANEGKGILTVADGKMTIHVSLASKSIVNLYPGLKEDAQKDGAELLQPTEDEVTYSDGMKETVYGFDIPVPALDEEFDCALIGTKGKWYDHKVSVSNPEPYTEE